MTSNNMPVVEAGLQRDQQIFDILQPLLSICNLPLRGLPGLLQLLRVLCCRGRRLRPEALGCPALGSLVLLRQDRQVSRPAGELGLVLAFPAGRGSALPLQLDLRPILSKCKPCSFS